MNLVSKEPVLVLISAICPNVLALNVFKLAVAVLNDAVTLCIVVNLESTDAVYNANVLFLVSWDDVYKFKLAVDSCNLKTCAAIEAVRVWRVENLASNEPVLVLISAMWPLTLALNKFSDAVLSSILVNLNPALAVKLFTDAVAAVNCATELPIVPVPIDALNAVIELDTELLNVTKVEPVKLFKDDVLSSNLLNLLFWLVLVVSFEEV